MELNSEQLESLLVLLAGVIAIPLTALIVAGILKYAAKWSKEIVFYVRAYQPTVVAAVNEPTDPLIVWLDRYVPGESAKLLSAALPALLNALADGIAAGLGEAVPLQERAEDAAK